jgi:hypothetical protein
MMNTRCPGVHCAGCSGHGGVLAGLATVAAGVLAGWVLLQVAGTLAMIAIGGEALAALAIGGAWLLAMRRPARIPAPSAYATARTRAREVGSPARVPLPGRVLSPGQVAAMRSAGELPPARMPAQGRVGLAPRPGREYLSK